MIDSPELAGQKLLDAMPAGCELQTSVSDTGMGWEATASLLHPTDSPKPVFVGRGYTDKGALARAIDSLAYFWTWRTSKVAREYPQR